MERDLDHVFIHKETHNCAVQRKCIPCGYKINPSGIWLDSISGSKYRSPPNQRPECCPRSRSMVFLGPYERSQRILTLGDGDFSFSLSLARYFGEHAKAKLLCTSHESRSSVLTTYPSSTTILEELHSSQVQVLHEVDATSILKSIGDRLNEGTKKTTFHCVIWNFPCIRAQNGADGQVQELADNINLIRMFFQNVSDVLVRKRRKGLYGEVHITHKTLEPFCWWNIEQIAIDCGFVCLGTIVFDKCLFPSYINRKVLDKKSFPNNDALTYIFRRKIDDTGANVVESPTISNKNLIPGHLCRTQMLELAKVMGTVLSARDDENCIHVGNKRLEKQTAEISDNTTKDHSRKKMRKH